MLVRHSVQETVFRACWGTSAIIETVKLIMLWVSRVCVSSAFLFNSSARSCTTVGLVVEQVDECHYGLVGTPARITTSLIPCPLRRARLLNILLPAGHVSTGRRRWEAIGGERSIGCIPASQVPPAIAGKAFRSRQRNYAGPDSVMNVSNDLY